jgi:hypothetical protein
VNEERQREHLTKKGKEVESVWELYYDKEYSKERHEWNIARHDFGSGDYHFAIGQKAVCAECGALLPKDDQYRKGIEQGRIFSVWKIISKYNNGDYFAKERDMDVWQTCSIDCALNYRNKNRISGVKWKYRLTTAFDERKICKGGLDEIKREPFYYGGSPGLGKRG